jgi:putative addiction module killer protein
MVEIRKTELFAKWIDGLQDIRARARILVRIERLAAGNPGDVKPVGGRVSELRIDYGPGYRVYYT